MRPWVLPVVAFAGIYLAVQELERSPLHHNTIIWVLGFGVAGAAIMGGYKEIRNRILLRRWLRLDEPTELADLLPQVRKAVAALPPWHRSRFDAKKAQIEEGTLTGPRHGRHHEPAAQRLRRQHPGLADHLRNSAAFVSSVLLLGVVGAYAWVRWLQIVVAGFGDPTAWLVTWVLVAMYFVGVAGAVWVDSARRRHRRVESGTQDA